MNIKIIYLSDREIEMIVGGFLKLSSLEMREGFSFAYTYNYAYAQLGKHINKRRLTRFLAEARRYLQNRGDDIY